MILIWAVLTATIGLALQLKQLAAEIRAAQLEKAIAGFFNGINLIPGGAINAFFDAVHFNPAAILFTTSGLTVQVIHLIIMLGILYWW